jgi:formylglycine-generating enzyme required for sulfatase activity
VTNAQYCAFLNAKASASDPLALWNSNMSGTTSGGYGEGGISRSGSGPYTYTVNAGMANQPVVFVTWYDTLRFANWLDNGQGNGSTESGSYTLLGGTPTPSNYSTISRNPGAQWFLPNENEWYKAAYYDPTLNSGSGGYWGYPTWSNTAPIWELSTSTGPNPGSNSANFYDPALGFSVTGSTNVTQSQDYLTDVGAYPNAVSAYGTLDQGGDVFQWNEALIGSYRGLRGGGWSYDSNNLASSFRDDDAPTIEDASIGFRVAEIPEPGSLVMLLGFAVAALLYYWRKHV